MPRALSPITPNAGIAAAYRARLDQLITEMHASILRAISAAYRANPPVMAQDEAPITALRAAMRKLARRWGKNFDDLAPKLATHFAKDASERVDRRLRAMLREAGMTVKFAMTAAQRDAYQAVIAENVGLIKSIAERHLTSVETLVMKSVQTGRDLGSLTKALHEGYGVTKRRAALIARSQNNSATAVLVRTRQLEVGITTAKWRHSAGGHNKRPTHVAFSGSTYKIADGVVLDPKEGVAWPGSLVGCKCVSIPVIDALL
jgi:uncharacterized protein with gpF-like domain